MKYDNIILAFIIFFLCLLILFIIAGVGLVAGYIASMLGFTGIMWWAVTLVFYIIISGIILMINRIGGN